MECLYCGDCCLRMSPISNPCLRILLKGNFVFCEDYERRPWQCQNHRFDSRFCPIGMEKLKIRSLQDAAMRIDEGWKLIEEITQEESHE